MPERVYGEAEQDETLSSSTCQTCRASRSSALVPSFQISPAWQWSRSTAPQNRVQLPLSPPAVLPTGGGTFKEGPLCMLPGTPMPTSGACSDPACPATRKQVSADLCVYCYTPFIAFRSQSSLHTHLPHVYVSSASFVSVSVCRHVLCAQGDLFLTLPSSLGPLPPPQPPQT